MRPRASSVIDSELISFCQREGLLSLLARSARGAMGHCVLPETLRAQIDAQERRQSALAMRVEGVAAALQPRLDAIPDLRAVFCGRLFHRRRYPGIPLPEASLALRLLVLCGGRDKALHSKLVESGFHPTSRLARYEITRRWLGRTIYRRDRTTLQVSRSLDPDSEARLDAERIWRTREQQIVTQGGVWTLSHEYVLLEQLLTIARNLRARRLPAFEIAELFFMLRTVDATMDWPAFFATRDREGIADAAFAAISVFLDVVSARNTIPRLEAFMATSGPP